MTEFKNTEQDLHRFRVRLSVLGGLVFLASIFIMAEPVRARAPFLQTVFAAFDRPEDRPHTIRWLWTQILASYLNIAYFGAGAYGIEAASRRYFSKRASELTLPEASLLAGLVQQPVGYDPLRHPQAATERRSAVLRRMVRLNFITQADADRVEKTRVVDLLHPSSIPNGCTGSIAPFFCDYVLQTIRQDPVFGATPEEREAFLRRGGYTIRTTLNPTMQAGADKAVLSHIPADDPSQRATAISMVQPGTGQGCS